MFCQICEPECTDVAPGKLVPDPKNCSQYYVCLNTGSPSAAPSVCDNGTNIYFNPTEEECQGSATVCHDLTCVLPRCQLACDGTTDFVADPFDCNTYYECLPGEVSGPLTCPAAAPNYNSEREVCVADQSVCCTELCTPYCWVLYSQIPDPSDCAMFYVCMEVGLAAYGSNLHESCNAGQNYEMRTQQCSSAAPCTTLCGGTTVPPISGTSTPSTGVCENSLMCTETGYFAACTTCRQKYFHCTTVGQPARVEYCVGQLVFDTNPNNPRCVVPADCPSG